MYAAAQAAVAGFDTLSSDENKTFIYTGNYLNLHPLPLFTNLGVGKAASAHLIAVLSQSYPQKGYKYVNPQFHFGEQCTDKAFSFYYADERKEDGSSVGGGISGENGAEFYFDLASKKTQGPWDATFVGKKGYVDFHGK